MVQQEKGADENKCGPLSVGWLGCKGESIG